MNDTQHKIGKLLDETETERDAIHIAVVPVIAGERLWPGYTVGLVYGTTNVVKRKDKVYGQEALGIIDPFLEGEIKEGQRCFLFLYPNTITGMKHTWQHPAFDNPPPLPTNESERWLSQFADRWNFDFNEMISEASTTPKSGDYNCITAMGIDLHSREELGTDEPLFWHHLEAITGKKFNEEHRAHFGWSCSC